MSGFWYPYSGFPEAQRRLSFFVDHTVGPACGITYSDGVSLGVVRRPRGGSGRGQWLNVLRHHVSAPPPHRPQASTRWQRFEHAVGHFFELVGQGEIQRAEAERAQSEAMVKVVHDYVWQPAHQFLLRHKYIADGVAVALDVVGVVAGAALLVAAAPELVGGAVVVGTAGIITGALAAAGSSVLLFIDGTIFAAEVTGNEARAEAFESSHEVQWLRITATLMLLPDLPVGGVRALKEIGRLGREAGQAGEAARLAQARAVAQRERAARINNPARHPGPVQGHLARANRAVKQALEQQAEVTRVAHRMRLVTARDINASFVATPGSTALLAGLPPSIVLSPRDRARDLQLLESLSPEHGMPRDTRLEVRISGIAPFAGHH